MTITKQTVADQLAAYLHHELTLGQLVDWSERALLDGELVERGAATLSSAIVRLGVVDAEDVLELRKAKRVEGKKRFLPLAEVKRELGLS